jgi:hypothetical protein
MNPKNLDMNSYCRMRLVRDLKQLTCTLLHIKFHQIASVDMTT